MTPSEVRLVSLRDARRDPWLIAPMILVPCGFASLVVLVEPWWAAVLWILGCLVIAERVVSLWRQARRQAREVANLYEFGMPVQAEVLRHTVKHTCDGSSVHDLKLRIPLPGGGFDVLHGCWHNSCNTSEAGDRVSVLVDPSNRSWGVVH